MAEHDDIKRRFSEKLKAGQAEGQEYRVRGAESAERAFAPIIQTIEAMAEAVAELGDTSRNIRLDHPSEDGKGNYEIKVFFNRGQVNKQVTIRLAPDATSIDHFWIDGLDTDARKQLNGETSIANPAEIVVPANRASDVAGALETFGLVALVV